MKHIVFVESNSCGLLAIKTAKEQGNFVSFIRSSHFEYMYKHDDIYKNLSSFIDQCIILDDILNEEKLYEVMKEVHRNRRIDAVISVLEYVILSVARVAERIGLPYTSLEGIENSRDKSKMRQKLKEQNLNNADFICGDDYKTLLNKADELGYPLIVKPARGVASCLVKKVNNFTELKSVLGGYKEEFYRLGKVYRDAFSEKILIEKHLTGQLFSLEIGVLDCEYFPFGIIQAKRYSKDEAIELGGTMNSEFPPEIINTIYQYGINVLKAIGLNLGIFHMEMILTESGPVVIDLNSRLAGGFGPKMISLVIGYNIYEVLIDIHLKKLEKILSMDFSPKCYATDREFACSEAGIFGKYINLQWLDNFYNKGLTDFRLDISPGEKYKKVTSNHDYIGTIVVQGLTYIESKTMAENILLKIKEELGVPLIIE